MTTDSRNDLGKILKQRRVMIPMTLQELSRAAGVSSSHLGRIERGERFPSAHILRRLAKPLGFAESELFMLANFLPPQPSDAVESSGGKQLDPYVASVLSQEPIEVQRAVVTILSVMKGITRGMNGRC
ncbi:MAG: helix-turn-helix transcriptional regulator [Bacteroidales bacterium]|nr:helix-turn-helix transcriptional regulator [Bacteroidales bacterium]